MRRFACPAASARMLAFFLPGIACGPLSCASPAPPAAAPLLAAIAPLTVAGGSEFELTARGDSFAPGDVLTLDGQPLATSWVSAAELRAHVPAQRRGHPAIAVQRADLRGAA